MVLLLISILAVVALPRFFSRNSFDERVLFDDTISALRYAQKQAVATGCQVQFQSTTTLFRILQDDSCNSGTFSTEIRHPATGDIGYSGSQSNVNMTAATITFFPLGNASTDASIQVGHNTIIVVAATGFVYAQ